MLTRLAFVLPFLLIAHLASAADPQKHLGYDDRGRLVEQPRLTVNMFELADGAAEANKNDLRAFGRWVADTLQLFHDFSASQAASPLTDRAALRQRAAARGGNLAPADVEALMAARLPRLEEMSGRLQQLRPAKAQQPDISRAATFAARDFADVGRLLGHTVETHRFFVKAALGKDQSAKRDGFIAEMKNNIALMTWSERSTRRQIEAGVGGTPDQWLWRAQVEAAQAYITTFRDLLYMVENRRMPPTIGQVNSHENSIAMAEWLKRAQIQVRHEMQRARGPDASTTRGLWLEKVYANYDRELAAERALREWMLVSLPRLYAEMTRCVRDGRDQVPRVNWDEHEQLSQAQLALTIERYRLLVQMP